MNSFLFHASIALRSFFSVLCAGALLGLAAPVRAINASAEPVEVTQPDGRVIMVRARGDEFCHWYEDVDGFAVVIDRGRYVYAASDAKGALAPTALVVGRDNPRVAGLAKSLRPTAEFIRGERDKLLRPAAAFAPVPNIAPAGTVKNLVILMRFSDHTLGVHTRAPADYDILFNSVGGNPVLAPTGSVKDYYKEASYGTLTLNSTIMTWVTLPHTEAYYGNGTSGLQGSYPANAQGMIEDALNAADGTVNFSQFDTDNDGFVDAITFIHSGYAGETGAGGGNWMWSHRWSLFALPGGKWTSGDKNANNVNVKVYDYHTEAALFGTSGTNITRIGVIAHETGHFFGLPDLYDTDNSSEGLGSYCLMANSWGFDNSQKNPPHPSAWCKKELGWLTPVSIVPGTYNAPRVETVPTVYRITNGFLSGEYLLIENRQPVGSESIMPQGGLAIWHIDEGKADNKSEGFPGQAGWPGNNNHYKIALLQADGAYDMEHKLNRGDSGDVYRGGGVSFLGPNTVPNTGRYQGGAIASTGIQITNISASASNMTFVFSIAGTNNNTTVPGITGFSPPSGGVSASVAITGTNFTGATAVKFNSVTASYIVNSGIQITATVPAGATTGPISVTTPGGTATSTSNFVVSSSSVPNDHFVNAQVLTGINGTVNGSTVGATKEASEPNHFGNAGGASVWFRWTAIGSGSTTIDTLGSGFDTLLAIYTGPSVGSLTVVTSNDDTATNQQSAVRFDAVAGTTYQIAVDGYNGASGGITLHWNAQPPSTLTNDLFATAQNISGLSGAAAGNNSTATKEAGEPDHFGVLGGKSLWYRWTAPADGSVAFDTGGSSFDTLLAAYTGTTVNGLTPIAGNDDINGTVQSLVAFNAVAGVTYRIAVDGYHGASGDISLHWSVLLTTPRIFDVNPASGGAGTTVTIAGTNFAGVTAVQFNGVNSAYAVNAQTQIVATVPGAATTGLITVLTTNGNATSPSIFTVTASPGHDSFAGATILDGSSGTVGGGNVNATKEAGEPNHAGNFGGASVWYRWTAPSTGVATIDTVGSSFDTTLGIYVGGAVSALALVVSNDDIDRSIVQSSATFAALAGTTYRVAIDGFNFNDGFGPEMGTIVLHWGMAPNNDAFANATIISGTTITVVDSSLGATIEDFEPFHGGDAGGKSVWFRWTAPTNGPTVVSTFGSSFDTLLGVYTGASVGSLTTIAGSDDYAGLTSQVTFNAISGVTYSIAVDGFGADSGNVVLSVAVLPLLRIRGAGNSVVLSWPTNYAGYTLESTPAAGTAASWGNVLPLPTVNSGMYTVTNTTAPGQRFFRLYR